MIHFMSITDHLSAPLDTRRLLSLQGNEILELVLQAAIVMWSFFFFLTFNTHVGNAVLVLL